MKSATIKDPLIPNPVLTAMAGKDNPYLESAWPASFMEPFLHRADPLADTIVQQLYAQGRTEAEAAGDPSLRPKYAFLFLSLLINRMSIPDPDVEYPFAAQGSKYQFPEPVREALRTFIREAQKLPVWADSQLIRDGQKLFANNPLLAYPMLAFLSLPVLYTCGRGATQVLSLTEQISLKVRRRVVETGSLVMQAMQEGSFVKMPEHPTLTHPVPVGIEAILRVRLLHAATRTIIHEFWQDGIRDREQNREVRTYQNKPADQIWQESWGPPINQQYLAGTLMSFSFLDLYGLETLGVIATPEEKRGYMHVWNVFGSILGIDEAFLKRLESPNDFASTHAKRGTAEEMVACGQALLTRMSELNRAYDQEGIEGGRMLTAAIITYISGVIRRYLPILSR
ncbi:MAG TPA: oxygenase MpaB family protein, partial [Candidatus Kapabacteria bacterium]